MMSKYLLLFTTTLFLTACAGGNFDEAAIPPDQLTAELAFKRMADHGELEPVLENRQLIDGWQFHVSSGSEGSVMNGPKKKTVYLKDRSGIEYRVTSDNSPGVIDQIEIGTYGFARGRVHEITRNLTAGEIEVELLLSHWNERAVKQ